MTSNEKEDAEVAVMLSMVEECAEKGKLHLIAKILYRLQTEYREVSSLATDGAYQPSWTHQQVLDHLTFNAF